MFVELLFKLLSWGKLPSLEVKLLPLLIPGENRKRIGNLISQFRQML